MTQYTIEIQIVKLLEVLIKGFTDVVGSLKLVIV